MTGSEFSLTAPGQVTCYGRTVNDRLEYGRVRLVRSLIPRYSCLPYNRDWFRSTAMNVQLRSWAVNVSQRGRSLLGDCSRVTPEENRNVWLRDYRNNSYYLHYCLHCEENLTGRPQPPNILTHSS